MVKRKTGRKHVNKRRQKKIRRTRKFNGVGGNPSTSIPLIEVLHFTERVNKAAPTEIKGVPLNIYQSWSTMFLPPKMKECVDKLKATNPEFNHYLYSDEKCLAFIKNNFDQEVVDAFNKLKPGAYKSDLWRYCILYKLGGVYIDIKFCTSDTVSLKAIIEQHPEVFVLDIDTSSNMCESKISIYNGFMISAPGDNRFKKCIDSIMRHCKEKLYNNTSLSITGPCLLGTILSDGKRDQELESYKKGFIFNLTLKGTIQMSGKNILEMYPEYREEQKNNSKSAHYAEMWMKRDVYN
jgi:mannosyltransferase OCH1-like enzyme